jgi:hypothetical protein
MEVTGESLNIPAVAQTGCVEGDTAPQSKVVEREGKTWPRAMALMTCLAMVLVVAHQGRTIDAQKSLIRLLWGDSRQLTNIQVNEITKQREKMYLSDPQYATPNDKAAKPAPAPKPKAKREPAPSIPVVKATRLLWRT